VLCEQAQRIQRCERTERDAPTDGSNPLQLCACARQRHQASDLETEALSGSEVGPVNFQEISEQRGILQRADARARREIAPVNERLIEVYGTCPNDNP
jgi:hypothetical protein